MSAVPIAPMEFERRLAFEGCFNFRDLGGYPTHDGRWVRPELLYRADGPHALSALDIDRLQQLALSTVIDLRTEVEVAERGCYVAALADAIEYHLPLIDVLPDTESLPGWIEPGVVALQYREMLEQGEDAIAETLGILSDPSAYPAMFHCSAGKDRTGVVAALLLGLLGVPVEAIIADYALSADAMHGLVGYYQAKYPDAREQLDRLAPAVVAAHPDTMAAFLAAVRREFGTFDRYADAIGAGRAARDIRSVLLG